MAWPSGRDLSHRSVVDDRENCNRALNRSDSAEGRRAFDVNTSHAQYLPRHAPIAHEGLRCPLMPLHYCYQCILALVALRLRPRLTGAARNSVMASVPSRRRSTRRPLTSSTPSSSPPCGKPCAVCLRVEQAEVPPKAMAWAIEGGRRPRDPSTCAPRRVCI